MAGVHGLLLLLLVAIHGFFTPQTPVAADNPLTPFLSPVLNALCKTVECGKGDCEVSSNNTLGFVCNCRDGWTQTHIADHLRFLPCVIPNCSLDYSCDGQPSADAPAPSPPSNFSLLDPCKWSYCGGGSCVKTSTFGHRCDCNSGYSNVLNVTSLPCFRDCSLGADCARLGITLSNATASPTSSPGSPSLSDKGNSSNGGLSSPKYLLWLIILAISVHTHGHAWTLDP